MALDVQNQHPQSLQEPYATSVLTAPPSQSGGRNHQIATSLRRPDTTLDLFHHHHNPSPTIELDEPSPLPLGWQKFLNLQTGEVYYSKTKFENEELIDKKKMSRRNGPKLDLKLNLSPPRANHRPRPESPTRSLSVSPTSPPSSCVSSELNQQEYSTSPEATSMMLVGCPRCLMYVMLSEEDPRCPKCKSTVLLDFIHDNSPATTSSSRKKKNKN